MGDSSMKTLIVMEGFMISILHDCNSFLSEGTITKCFLQTPKKVMPGDSDYTQRCLRCATKMLAELMKYYEDARALIRDVETSIASFDLTNAFSGLARLTSDVPRNMSLSAHGSMPLCITPVQQTFAEMCVEHHVPAGRQDTSMVHTKTQNHDTMPRESTVFNSDSDEDDYDVFEDPVDGNDSDDCAQESDRMNGSTSVDTNSLIASLGESREQLASMLQKISISNDVAASAAPPPPPDPATLATTYGSYRTTVEDEEEQGSDDDEDPDSD